MSGIYGRQELPEQSGADPEHYLRLLHRRQTNQRPVEDDAMRYSDLRWRLLSAMISDPDREWTANTLAVSLESGPRSQGTVDMGARTQVAREALTVLMADQWVEPVPFQQALTVRLTAAGRAKLRQLLLQWSAAERHDAGAD